MSIDSMKQLLGVAEKINNKQLIFAISKFTKGYSEEKIEHDITIEKLTVGLKNYNEIEIDGDGDGEKLISEID
ncbi:hypothetical protein [Enterovibrio norvegicus]|uniref:hypothetical protein n=1 Tax=Enterovibrio norvegicus TaxID=188144 RepID=UPI0024B10481|nr:hypothetical protein [Enterovibrio norvegicus]